jgi:hypothetical protein
MFYCSISTHIQSLPIIFTLLHFLLLTFSLPLVPTFRQNLFCLSVFPFFISILITLRGLTSVFHTCICYTLIRLTCFIICSFSIALLPLFKSCQYNLLLIFIHKYNVFQYYSFSAFKILILLFLLFWEYIVTFTKFTTIYHS